MNKDRRLGRGLAALLGEEIQSQPDANYQQPDPNFQQPEGMPQDGGFGDGQHQQDVVHPPQAEAPAPQFTVHSPYDEGDSSGGNFQQPDQPSPASYDAAWSDGGDASQGNFVPAGPSPAGQDTGILLLNVYEIDDNPFQPRRQFSEPEIASLAESLKTHDMIQPIVVRPVDGRYQLISGERRLRAAIQAGWSQVPARVRDADDRLVAELAIVENLQRKDLNPIEKALSFQRYIHEHGCTQEDLAQRIKIDRSTIANLMRLLELPDPVKDAVQAGTLSAGHARAMLPLGDYDQQISLADRIRREGLSVRDTERLVQERIMAEDAERLADPEEEPKSTRNRRQRSQQIAALEKEFRMALGTKVDVRQGSRGRGRIVIHFASHEEFDRLRDHLTDGQLPGLRSDVA